MSYILNARFWSKVIIPRKGPRNSCWEWNAAKDGAGYGLFHWPKGKMYKAHRIAWELANGQEIPRGMNACHKCDNPSCVRPDHIFIGTTAENVADREAKGRSHRHKCEHHPMSKLSKSEILEIRENSGQLSHLELAEKFGVCRQHISSILSGKRWKL